MQKPELGYAAYRRTKGWLLYVVIALAVTGGLGSVGRAAGDSYRVQTEHYNVETDVSERFTELVSQHMEEIYQEYQRRFREYDLKDHDRFDVKVFERRQDYERAVPSQLAGSAGAFVSQEKLLAACQEGQTSERVFQTLYHEGFHQFLFSCIRADVPLWVNEGFAEYFAESVWNGKQFETGKIPAQRLQVLNKAAEQNELLPFKKLFLMETENWLGNVRKGEASVQYSQAWSIIHFLCHARGGRHRKRLLLYVRKLSEGDGREEAFEASFGGDIDGFEKAWYDYIQKLKPSRESQCRANMAVLMQMGQEISDGTNNFTSLGKLREKLSSDRLRWSVRMRDGRELSSSDQQAVGRVFKCPYDQGSSKQSYLLIKNRETGLPELYCIHHRGNVMRAYYDQSSRDLHVRVERIVKETLPDSVEKAIKRKIR